MVFRFVHTADWQIGKPFAQFDAETGAILREQRLAVIDEIATVCRSREIGHVLVAGDVFDTTSPAERTLRQPLAKLARYAGISWHLIPGNHDHARPGGLWARLRATGLPGNVIVHDTAQPMEIATGVWLLPAPLTGRSQASDPTAWMDHAETPAGAIRIGLAHGSVRGFGSDNEASVLIRPDRVASAGLAYLALGDWHGLEQVAERVWYSGTPEPDRFPENNPGYVLAVALASNSAAVEVERVRTARFHWQKMSVELHLAADFADLEAVIAACGTPAENVLLQLAISGRLTLGDDALLAATLARLAATLRFLDIDQTGLAIAATGEDVSRLDSAELEAAACQLRDEAARSEGQQRMACDRALRQLYQFVQHLRGEGRP